ncbi:MFS transporter [Saccharothrix violaceirubra]
MLYAGGVLGPFGGAMTSSVLPELGRDFAVDPGTAAVSVTAYLVPFAALLLVSGTYGMRWGARRTVLVAYVLYALASVLCAVAWAFPVFLAGRAAQGVANAFTTPLLLATIASVTPAARLGRALGLFASLQSLGQTSAPLVGGLSAEVSWRLAFVGAAVVATVLAVAGLPADPARGERPRLRSAWAPPTPRLAMVGFVAWCCVGGLSFLVALRLGDVFGIGASQRGLVLTGFGVAGIVAARSTGRLVERWGATRCVLVGALAGGLLIAGAGALPGVLAVAGAWALAGAVSQVVVVGLNAAVLGGVGDNRGGAVSVVQSLRFVGGAVAPVAFVPLYAVAPSIAFLVPAALVMTAVPTLLAGHPKR